MPKIEKASLMPFAEGYGLCEEKRLAVVESAKHMTQRQAAMLHNVSQSSVSKWVRAYREINKYANE